MSGKWLELLKGIAPHLVRVSLMFNPPTAPYGPGFLRSFETAAPSFAVKPNGALIHDPAEIEGIMSVLGSGADGGLIVLPDAFTDVHREQIIALAARHRVPTIYSYRYFTSGGGLISYGANSADMHRRAAAYIDRILKGEKPADLPVQRPNTFELAINLKTAKALGLNVPANLLALVARLLSDAANGRFETLRRLPAPWDSKSRCSTPAPFAKSIRPSRPSQPSEQTLFLSAAMGSSTAGVFNLPCWRCATRFRRAMRCVIMSMPAG
jgi:hypothetical protein